MMADLHGHFPMHLVSGRRRTCTRTSVWLRWWHRVRDDLEAEGFDLVARLLNHRAGRARGGARASTR